VYAHGKAWQEVQRIGPRTEDQRAWRVGFQIADQGQVLVAANSQNAQAVGCRKVGQCVIAFIAPEELTQYIQIIVKGRDPQAFGDDIGQVIGKCAQAIDAFLDQQLVVSLLPAEHLGGQVAPKS